MIRFTYCCVLTGGNGQPLVHRISIDSVNGSSLMLKPGESRNITCTIAVAQINGYALIEFYRTGYRRIMQPMNVTNPHSCGSEMNSLTLCYRVAVIRDTLKGQNIQCAFHVSGKVFYSKTVTVLGKITQYT